MKVKVEVFGPLRRYLSGYDPNQGLEVEIPVGTRVIDLLSRLGIPQSESGMITVNGDIAEPNEALGENASVLILPYIGGG